MVPRLLSIAMMKTHPKTVQKMQLTKVKKGTRMVPEKKRLFIL